MSAADYERLEERIDALESGVGELHDRLLQMLRPRSPSLVTLDGDAVVLRYPDGSVARGSSARLLGPSLATAEGVETWADVELEP